MANLFLQFADIFDYYLDKDCHDLATQCFDIIEPTPNKGYRLLYSEFSGTISSSKLANDELSFYEILSAWEKKTFSIYNTSGEHFNLSLPHHPALSNLKFLTRVKNLNILHPSENIGGNRNQKWHLYVAVLTYNAVCGYNKNSEIPWMWDNLDTYWNLPFPQPTPQFSSPALQTWLVENAQSKQAGKYSDNLNQAFINFNNGNIDKNELRKSISHQYTELVNYWNMPS